MEFIGRKNEMRRLEELKAKDAASLVVITGRRRIGKSRLAREFGREFPLFLEFAGLAPRDGIGAAEQRAEFARLLAEQCNLPRFESRDWGELFRLLARETARDPVLILLDEISWMARGDELFLPQLKNAWDLHFSRNSRLILVLCGSISSWIEKNILSHTGFVGRISLRLVIRDLSLPHCNQFWGAQAKRTSAHDKLKVLAVTGGVPRYLEEIQPQQTAEQNIGRLCFREGAPLFDEFDRIFSDLFDKKAQAYRKIVQQLAKGAKDYQEIARSLDRPPGGTLTQHLDDLVSAGFLQRHRAWSLSDSRALKYLKYRLSDNYSRFYLKYIQPHKEQIVANRYPDRALTFLPGWDSIMALQFENLVLNNSAQVSEALGLSAVDVLNAAPYFQTATQERRGAQVDLLIQERFGSLFVCEIKFTRGELGQEVITAMAGKLENLKVPRSMSLRPVLVHCGDVSEAVVQSRFFAHIVPFERFLTESAS